MSTAARPGCAANLLLRLKGPLMGFGGVKIDAYGDHAPVPLVSMVTGLLGAALGVSRRQPETLQAMQDAIDIAVAVLRHGQVMIDYQTADLGKPHLRGPMWTVEGVPVQRAGSAIEETRQTFRPYIADADVLVVARLGDGFPFAPAEVETALREPHFPLFLGRVSCPPSRPPFAGWIDGVLGLREALTAGLAAVGVGAPASVWFPATLVEPEPGDVLIGLSGRRDWVSDRHMGAETYLHRRGA